MITLSLDVRYGRYLTLKELKQKTNKKKPQPILHYSFFHGGLFAVVTTAWS